MSQPVTPELVTTPIPDPVRPLNITQATPQSSSPIFDETGRISNFRRNEETGELFDATGLTYQDPGVGAPSDDAGTNTLSKNFSEANFAYNNLIKPQPNILDNYASYTYNLSLYMLTPRQVTDLYAIGRANTASWNLLMASGGAGSAKRDQAPNGAPVGRNKYFSDDFYIDNVVIKTALTGAATGTSSSFVYLSFSIFEPYGITLIPLIGRAYTDMMKNANYTLGQGTYNLATANFCLLITFYGYDDTGKLVKVGANGVAPNKTIASDAQAIVEKYYIFTIKDLKFKVASRGITEYQVEGVLSPTLASDTDRGIIKNASLLVGETLGDILSGPKQKASPVSPGERVDTPIIRTAATNAPDPSTIRESQEGYSDLF